MMKSIQLWKPSAEARMDQAGLHFTTPSRLLSMLAISCLCLTSVAVCAAKNVPVHMEKDVVYKTTPQGDLSIDIYYPEKKLKGEYPAVIYTHGGGWAAGSKAKAWSAQIGQVNQGLIRQGFCVVAVQYRLVSKGGATAMRDCVIDAKDAIRYLAKNRKRLHVNTDQIFPFGDSAGGQMAQMLLLSPPESLPGDESLKGYSYKTIAGLSWYGPCDFEKPELFNHDDRKNFRDRFGARILYSDTKPEDKLAMYREMSPIHYLKKDSPPLMMIQGDGDTTIPVKHAYHMDKRAKELGAPVEIMIVKHAGHNWRQADGTTPIQPAKPLIYKKSVEYILSHLPK
jgi:acetyl esterase/lipase